MQQLHVVGFTADLDGLILSPRKGSKSGNFFVPVDNRLKGAIEEMEHQRQSTEESGGEVSDDGRSRRGRPPSSLTPREMQARLRAGSTLADVAREAGIDEEYVEPFAVPILAERAQVVSRAQDMSVSKARRGESAEPLGSAVRWNLAARGLGLPADVFDAAWTAWNVTNGTWIVRFSYAARRRQQAAEWLVDVREGSVVARNRLASELGYLEPGQRRYPQPLGELADARADGAAGRDGTARSRPAPAARTAKKANPKKKPAVRVARRPAAKPAAKPVTKTAPRAVAKPGPKAKPATKPAPSASSRAAKKVDPKPEPNPAPLSAAPRRKRLAAAKKVVRAMSRRVQAPAEAGTPGLQAAGPPRQDPPVPPPPPPATVAGGGPEAPLPRLVEQEPPAPGQEAAVPVDVG